MVNLSTMSHLWTILTFIICGRCRFLRAEENNKWNSILYFCKPCSRWSFCHCVFASNRLTLPLLPHRSTTGFSTRCRSRATWRSSILWSTNLWTLKDHSSSWLRYGHNCSDSNPLCYSMHQWRNGSVWLKSLISLFETDQTSRWHPHPLYLSRTRVHHRWRNQISRNFCLPSLSQGDSDEVHRYCSTFYFPASIPPTYSYTEIEETVEERQDACDDRGPWGREYLVVGTASNSFLTITSRYGAGYSSVDSI